MSNSLRPQSGYSERYNAAAPLMKVRLENEIVRRREAENRRSESARSNDLYFQHWNVQNEKFDDWTSPKSIQLSQRYTKQRETEMEVQERREKLKQLYQEDKRKQDEALKKLQEEEEQLKWEKMKDKVHNFRHSKSLKSKDIAERSEHEQWKANSTEFRAFESELKRQQQQEIWGRQIQEKEEEKLRQDEEKHRERLEMERLVEEDKQKWERERGMEQEKKQQWKRELDAQMELLKSKDCEADEKRHEHERLMVEALALEAAKEEIQRKEDEKQRKKQNGEFWTKQHLAKLRQRSKEVADDLESEASFAEKLFRQAEKDAARNKERTRQEISRYLDMLSRHRQLEKERQQQTNFIFQEEAKRMWEKRELEWEAERLARKKLIEEVIGIQKKQIDDKVLSTKLQREKLLKEREVIVETLESYHRQIKEREEEGKAKQNQTKADLLAQMELKEQRERELAAKEKQDVERQRALEAAREEKHWSIAMNRLRL